jgi:putative peptide zinc metalloprotease protein
MLRPQSEAPRMGWRRALFQLSGGLINLGPGAAELRDRELIARVKAPVAGCRRIAVVSRKGGVGKTTTTLMLGHTFASYRGDRVIALDGNPHAGSLGYRVRRETTNTIMSLLAHRDEIARYADIRAYTSQAPTRLEVVAADDDPRITDALREQDFANALELLEVHYNLVCMDTGTGVLESAAKGILRLADQLVVVTAPSLDSARTASSTLDWLDRNGPPISWRVRWRSSTACVRRGSSSSTASRRTSPRAAGASCASPGTRTSKRGRRPRSTR